MQTQFLQFIVCKFISVVEHPIWSSQSVMLVLILMF